jgi:hemoglobin-like flavoprotein
MNDHTIALVRESFDLIEPIAPQAGAMFYANLFEAEPSLQPLLAVDPAARGAELMQLVALAVARLDQPELLMPVLQKIGQQHAGRAIGAVTSETLLAALLRTLHQALGVAYNAEVEEAWVDVYGVLAAKMKVAAAMPV